MPTRQTSFANQIGPGLLIAGTAAAAVLASGWSRSPQVSEEPTAQQQAVAAAQEPQYFYSYYKEALPLTLKTGRIAVLSQPAENAREPMVALEAIGVSATDLSAGPVDGWWLATPAPDAKSNLGIRDLVRLLAADEKHFAFSSPVFQDEYGPVLITPELLVGFNADVTVERAAAILQATSAGTITEVNYAHMDNVYRVRSASRDGFRVLETANALAQHAEVKFAEPDMIRTAQLMHLPNDPFFPRQWALHNVGQNPFLGMGQLCCSVPCTGDCWPPCPDYCLGGPCENAPGGLFDFDVDAPEAWDITIGDPSIIVAIFDQGTQLDHPDLLIPPELGADFVGQGGGGFPIEPCDWHGTAVAGIIRGQIDNDLGIAGLAPGANVASARVLRSSVTTNPCGGESYWSPQWIIAGLDWAAQIGARVTNHSYGIGESAALSTKFQQLREQGILHFAAAGNSGGPSISYPASLPSVLSVSATQYDGSFWPESSFGSGLDFAAPGVFLFTTDIAGDQNIGGFGVPVCNDYDFVLGTSFSSPLAAGVAALVLSVDESLSATEVEQIMRLSATDLGSRGYDPQYGWGMVNAFGTVRLAQACRSDVNRDGHVNSNDLATLLAHYGDPDGATRADGDIDGNGAVNLNDLAPLLSSFGTACSQ